MNKTQSTIFKVCLIGSAILIALASGIITSLMLFLFVGKIPGTSTYLSPLQMGLILSVIASLMIYASVLARHKHSFKKRYDSWKASLPKHRFTQA